MGMTSLTFAPTHSPQAEPEVPPSLIRLIQVLLEAMAGRRALHQVRPLLDRESFTQLARYSDTGMFRRMRVGPVRAQMPTQCALEATVSLLFAQRPVSCVIRLDLRRGRWTCTELTVLQPAALQAAA